MKDTHWTYWAACSGLGELFDLDTPKDRGAPHLRLLKRICDSCPVFDECLADTLKFEDEYTFRAGMSPIERARRYGIKGIL